VPLIYVQVFYQPDKQQTLDHEPGCFGLEEERGANWKGSGQTVPSIKGAKPSL
jgi:hypothetical protein